jgi:hypothetical protein
VGVWHPWPNSQVPSICKSLLLYSPKSYGGGGGVSIAGKHKRRGFIGIAVRGRFVVASRHSIQVPGRHRQIMATIIVTRTRFGRPRAESEFFQLRWNSSGAFSINKGTLYTESTSAHVKAISVAGYAVTNEKVTSTLTLDNQKVCHLQVKDPYIRNKNSRRGILCHKFSCDKLNQYLSG